MLRWLAFVTLSWTLASPALGQPTDPKAEREVRQMERQFNEARARADTATLDRLLADGWTITHGDGTIDTKAQYLADLKTGVRKFDYVKEDQNSVRLYGDTAVVSGLTESKVQYKGQSSGGLLRFTRVYVKRDGRWLMIVSHATRRTAATVAGYEAAYGSRGS